MRPSIRGLAHPLVVSSATALMFASASAQIPESQEPQSPVPESAQEPPGLPPEVALLEDKKLDQFADAYVAIERIHAQAESALAISPDVETASRVEQEAQIAMVQAVERSGLVVEEFNQIATLAELNPDLGAEVARRVDARRGI